MRRKTLIDGGELCDLAPDTVVVAPLIALMKDQVDQLQATGVAATFLNSPLDYAEARARLRGLQLVVLPRLRLDAINLGKLEGHELSA